MIYDELHEIISSHFNKLEETSGNIDTALEKEAIHKFRTTYKKLRAWLRLLNYAILMPEKIKIPDVAKDFYHALGEIRDRQIQNETIIIKTQGHPIKPDDYFRLLEEEIQAFGKLLKKQKVRKSIIQSYKKIPTEVRETDRIIETGKYIETKWDVVIYMVTQNQFEDDHLHTIRKILKDIFYITYKEDDKGIIPEVNIYMDEKDFKALLDEIGKFQDMCTALELLCDETLQDIKRKEKQLLLQVRNILTADKMKIKISVIEKLLFLADLVVMKRQERMDRIQGSAAKSISIH